MSGKLPIDRVRETRNAPKIFEEHNERLARQQAELRDADDPVAGARPQPDDPSDRSQGESTNVESPRDA